MSIKSHPYQPMGGNHGVDQNPRVGYNDPSVPWYIGTVKRSLFKSAALYVTLAYTPIPSFFGVSGPIAAGTASLIFGIVDIIRRNVVDPQLPADYSDWMNDTMGAGGSYMDYQNLWNNFTVAASCKACLVQALMYWGVLTFSGMFSGMAAGLAASSFVSTVLYDFIMGFIQSK